MTAIASGKSYFPRSPACSRRATGVAGILLALGLGLAASGIAVAMTQPPS